MRWDAGEFKKRQAVVPEFDNPSLAEQQNSKLARLKAATVHMNQFTFLWLVRWVLYKNLKAHGEGFRRRALLR